MRVIAGDASSTWHAGREARAITRDSSGSEGGDTPFRHGDASFAGPSIPNAPLRILVIEGPWCVAIPERPRRPLASFGRLDQQFENHYDIEGVYEGGRAVHADGQTFDFGGRAR